jgi:hypothetical protein
MAAKGSSDRTLLGYRLTGKLSPRERAERRWKLTRAGIEVVDSLERQINDGGLVAVCSADQGVS